MDNIALTPPKKSENSINDENDSDPRQKTVKKNP